MTTPNAEFYAAQSVLPPSTYAFVSGGAGTESTVRRNFDAWEGMRLPHRLPANVGQRDMFTTILGTQSMAPVAVAPMGGLGAVMPGADLAIARACEKAGVPMVVSTMASSTIEDIAAAGADLAFQLYPIRNRDVQADLIDRAEQAGYHALVVTIDTPMRHGSAREQTTGFTLPTPANFHNLDDAEIDPSFTWGDLEVLVGKTRMPVWVKGVLTAEQAQRAMRAGANGVIVSNHGGRQSDVAPATAGALPTVATTLEGPGLLVDSGVTTGSDVLRALALGADGALIGRQVVYGLAAGGEQGAHAVLTRIIGELDRAMACAGCSTLGDAKTLRA
ncbi:alpha-hydroxy-acid oxidizing protein [Saccharopolyspora aridisoli]|uniref:Alpha-hydroxy-acid oxidizing protein n=1 Tax=Saccharopolyspora aridisoli TaxID=2530385 RepID=A0A4V2Y7J7_9PSEU|nr:alpha-hydroxy acid oxidase [Saccharopolyspora aridisoli]TDC92345.1 alpha-hydroxy-acid oxidizing protein [Saccharopolyspora aridisoli]